MSYLQSTKQVFLTYTGDYIKLLLYADISREFSSLTFDDAIDSELSIYDTEGVLRLRKINGRVSHSSVVVCNGGIVVLNTSPDFEFDSTNSLVGVVINAGETSWFFPGMYSIKLSITFENNRVFTYNYKDALQILQS